MNLSLPTQLENRIFMVKSSDTGQVERHFTAWQAGEQATTRRNEIAVFELLCRETRLTGDGMPSIACENSGLGHYYWHSHPRMIIGYYR